MYKMGRYRTLSRSQDSVSYIDYYEKKNSISTLKYARSIVNTNKNTDNFKLNCCNTNQLTVRVVTLQYFSYASLMRLIKQQAYFDKNVTVVLIYR